MTGRGVRDVNDRASRGRVLLLRSAEYATTPALPRFAAVLGRIVGPARVDALCWSLDPRSETPLEAQDATRVMRFERRATSRSLSAVFGMAAWWARITAQLVRERYAVVQASDVFSLLPCVAAKPLLGYRVVADVRDHIGSISGTRWGLIATVLGWLESLLVLLSDAVIVVDDTRKELLPKRLRTSDRVLVVRNLPLRDAGPAGDRIDAEVRINFSGYLSTIRGADMLLDAVAGAKNAALDVVGETNDPRLRARLRDAPGVVRYGRVGHAEAIRRMGQADLVALLYDPAIAANRYAAPNKFYEAMMIGRPVLVSEGTPMAEWVRQHECGYVVAYGSVEAVVEAIERVRSDRREWRNRCRNARGLFERDLRWTDEAARLEAAYRRLGLT